MIVLVTNDDGLHSPGLRALADAAGRLGRVIVVAPDREKSACSHSLTLHHPLRIREVKPGVFVTDGTPADCVNAAANGLIGNHRPDLVLSGVNLGANLGDDVIYSGTVAAAEEATILGIPAVAVSLDATTGGHFEAVVEVAVRLGERLVAGRARRGRYYNVNAPNLPRDQVRGVRWTRLGARIYCDALERRSDPRGKDYFWIGGEAAGMTEVEGSDMQALREGYISVTPLRLDRTDEEALSVPDPDLLRP